MNLRNFKNQCLQSIIDAYFLHQRYEPKQEAFRFFQADSGGFLVFHFGFDNLNVTISKELFAYFSNLYRINLGLLHSSIR